MDRGAWGVLSVQSQRVGHEEQLTFSQAKIYHPGSTVVKNLPANARKHRRCGFDSWVGKMPWRSKWQPICLENSKDREYTVGILTNQKLVGQY